MKPIIFMALPGAASLVLWLLIPYRYELAFFGAAWLLSWLTWVLYTWQAMRGQLDTLYALTLPKQAKQRTGSPTPAHKTGQVQAETPEEDTGPEVLVLTGPTGMALIRRELGGEWRPLHLQEEPPLDLLKESTVPELRLDKGAYRLSTGLRTWLRGQGVAAS